MHACRKTPLLSVCSRSTAKTVSTANDDVFFLVAYHAGIWQTADRENTMSTITFDTFKFVDRLEKSGVPREQAALTLLGSGP
jgi:hypothetical protein